MPVQIYHNRRGVLHEAAAQFGLPALTGMWTSLSAADLDGDGYEDLVAGNWGENSKLQASDAYPLLLYTGDMDGNSAPDQILSVARQQLWYPFLGKEELERVLPALIRKKFPDYKSMAVQTVENILGPQLPRMRKLSVRTLRSVLLRNNRGRLQVQPLPAPAQWSPLFACITDDVDGDQKPDLITGGNFYGVLPFEGRYDAGLGAVLLNRGNSLQALPPDRSGLLLEGEVRKGAVLRAGNGKKRYVFARNNHTLLWFRKSSEKE